MFRLCSHYDTALPPQSKVDDRAFRIRVKVRIPKGGFGQQLNDILGWIREHAGSENLASHGAGLINGTAFHFRTVEAAGAFLIEFPDLELADYTTGPSYTWPLRSASSIDRPAAPPKIPW